MKFYDVADPIPYADKKALGLDTNKVIGPMPSLGLGAIGVHAIATREFRPPKAGEWYLSGAIPAAYRAPNNFSNSYYIAKLVRTKKEVKTTTTITIIE